MLWSVETASSASISSCINSRLSALRFSGRFRVMRTTGPSDLTIRLEYSISGPHVVHLARVHIKPVHHLPQSGQRLQAVAPLIRRHLVPVHLERPVQVPVRVDQFLFCLREFGVHQVAHGHGALRSPSVPMTTRSSTIRLALSSNLGSESSSAW